MKIGLYDLMATRYLAATYKSAKITPRERLLYEVEVSEDEISEKFTSEEVERIRGGSYWVAQVLMRDIVGGNGTLNSLPFLFQILTKIAHHCKSYLTISI